MRISVPKSIRKITLTIIILIIIFGVGGILYVYFADRDNYKSQPVTATKKYQVTPLPSPVTPAADALEGVSVEYVTSPVTQGQNSSVTINTNANSLCKISVTYNGVASTDSGLAPKNSTLYGTVTWTWTIGSNVPVGNWPIVITCLYHGRSAVVDSSVQVTK